MLNSLHSASVAATRTAPLSSETSSVAVSSSTVRASKRQRGEGHVRTAELSTTTTGGLPGSGSVCTWPGMDDYSQERERQSCGRRCSLLRRMVWRSVSRRRWREPRWSECAHLQTTYTRSSVVTCAEGQRNQLLFLPGGGKLDYLEAVILKHAVLFRRWHCWCAPIRNLYGYSASGGHAHRQSFLGDRNGDKWTTDTRINTHTHKVVLALFAARVVHEFANVGQGRREDERRQGGRERKVQGDLRGQRGQLVRICNQ